MTVNELIEQLQALPEDVRDRPLMDGEPVNGDWLAPYSRIVVDKVIVTANGSVLMVDPELSDKENLDDMEEFDRPARIEERAFAVID